MMSSLNLPHRQRGAALLVMMLVVIVGAAAILVSKLNRSSARIADTSESGAALAAARDALLGFAASYPDRFPGSPLQLPCPDIDDSGGYVPGDAHTVDCGAAGESVMGRVPWRTLGVAAPKDGASECLWYVVSGDWKSAGPTTAAMINPDTNGQFILYDAESGAVIEGQQPHERPAALIISPGQALPGQSRQAISQPGQQCSDDFNASDFLETDAGTGVSNTSLTGGVSIDDFVRANGQAAAMNDRIVAVSRAELADLVHERPDFDARIRDLVEAAAACVAEYGRNNPGGPDDRRLPWPGPVALTDYRQDVEYDDVAGGALSGRLADTVDDSNAMTGNTIARVLSDCSSGAVPAWTAEMRARWQHWKDHLFYYVSESFAPPAPVPSNCTSCVTVNGGAPVAAVLLFGGRRLAGLVQTRDAPPLDADTKSDVRNYLESRNSIGHPYTSGSVDLLSQPAGTTFNDVLYCIDSSLNVAAC